MKKIFLICSAIMVMTACKKTNKQDEPTPVAAEKVCLLDSVTNIEGENAYLKYKNNVLVGVESTEQDNSYFYFTQNKFIDSNFKGGVLRKVDVYFLNDVGKATKSVRHQIKENEFDTTYYFYHPDGYIIKDSSSKIVSRPDIFGQQVISLSTKTTDYTWAGGNLMGTVAITKENSYESKYYTNYEYYLDKIDNSIYFRIYPTDIITGNLNKNLLFKVKYDEGRSVTTYAYEFDANGRIIKLDRGRGTDKIETLHYSCK